MSDHLNIPPELNHLIEKRSGDERRDAPRRADDQEDACAEGSSDERTETRGEAAEADAKVTDQRGGQERRQEARRADSSSPPC